MRQPPKVQGGLVAMDPHTGRVLAMVGGFSYGQSEFNRATQAMRQPGSSFKPFVYAAALDNGYTPASVILDAPIEIVAGGQVWRPENYGGGSAGPSTLRLGIEKSRNLMTVRLANDMRRILRRTWLSFLCETITLYFTVIINVYEDNTFFLTQGSSAATLCRPSQL